MELQKKKDMGRVLERHDHQHLLALNFKDNQENSAIVQREFQNESEMMGHNSNNPNQFQDL